MTLDVEFFISTRHLSEYEAFQHCHCKFECTLLKTQKPFLIPTSKTPKMFSNGRNSRQILRCLTRRNPSPAGFFNSSSSLLIFESRTFHRVLHRVKNISVTVHLNIDSIFIASSPNTEVNRQMLSGMSVLFCSASFHKNDFQKCDLLRLRLLTLRKMKVQQALV